MRALLIVIVAVAACDLDKGSTAAPTPPPATARVHAASTRTALEDCRDSCEQTAILMQSPDTVLRACRAGCDGRFGAAATPPHEVPSRITRAAPVHAPPAVRPR